jgi:hypothetical protein
MDPVPRHIAFDRLYNFRDAGGYRTGDGRTVRCGRLYRPDSLGKLGGPDWEPFRALRPRSALMSSPGGSWPTGTPNSPWTERPKSGRRWSCWPPRAARPS